MEQSARLPLTGAVTGWAGCRLRGGNFFDGLAPDGRTRLPVPLAVGPGTTLRTTDGQVRLSFDRLPAAERTALHGVPTVGAERAVFDTMRYAVSVREAVVAVEMAVAALITSLERMRSYVRTRAGATGIGQVREALDLAREHARSPQEVRFRMVWEINAGLPRPEINCPVYTREGRLIGIADLLDLESGTAGEFDGADHRELSQHVRDVTKEDAMRRLGLEVVRATGPDMRTPEELAARVQAARARSKFEPEVERRWVARPRPPQAEQSIREREEMSALMRSLTDQPLAAPA